MCRTWVVRLGVAAGMLWAVLAPASVRAQANASALSVGVAPGVPLSELPAAAREQVRVVLQQPTLTTRGAAETFRGRPALYHWLLNHPDRGVLMWRQLGAKCMDITDHGQGRFSWKDKQGSEIFWSTVHDAPGMRVWYAYGNACPGALFPTVPVRAVAVLRYAESCDALGRPLIHHQADLYVQTDSKTAALVTKLLGAAVPRLARQCAGQLELFFSGIVWYVDKHPERAEALLMGNLSPGSVAARELRELLTESGIRDQNTGTSYNGTRMLTPRADYAVSGQN